MNTVLYRQFGRVNVNWPSSVAGEADSVSSVSHRWAGVNPGELALVYGIVFRIFFNMSLDYTNSMSAFINVSFNEGAYIKYARSPGGRVTQMRAY